MYFFSLGWIVELTSGQNLPVVFIENRNKCLSQDNAQQFEFYQKKNEIIFLVSFEGWLTFLRSFVNSGG